MKTHVILIAITLLITASVTGQVIHVPDDQPTIQAGINASTDGDTVLVASGTYFENIRFMGKAITLGSYYIIDGDSNTIVNTIIDGSQSANPDSAAVVMFVHGEDTTSILNGFTITGGTGVLNMTWQGQFGGGIYAFHSGCKIINNIITENHVERDYLAGGAGISIYQDQAGDIWTVIRDNYIGYNTATANGFSAFGGGIATASNSYVENNLIEHNTCTNTGGSTDAGGLEIEAFPAVDLFMYVRSNIIRNNTIDGSDGSMGGAIRAWDVDFVITDNLFENNTAIGNNYAEGGCLWIHGSDTSTLSNNIIQNNKAQATRTSGGGVLSWQNSDLSIIGNSFFNNQCVAQRSWGGALFSIGDGNLDFTSNFVHSNKMDCSAYWFGAGIWIDKQQDIITISDNLFQNNWGTPVYNWSLGGAIGIYREDHDSPVIVEQNLIKNNSAERGGAIWTANAYIMTVANNLFSNNTATVRGGGICMEVQGEMPENTFSRIPVPLHINNPPKRDETIHPILVNNTFLFNTAPMAGALYSNHLIETPVIFNSIFWGNEANNSPDISNYGDADMLVSYCVIDTNNLVEPWTGEGNIACNPALMNDSLHLHWDSQCLNTGAYFLTFDGTTFNSPLVDIDGDDRPYEGTAPDIGADEAPYTYVNVEELEVGSQESEVLCFPNPFSVETKIEYDLKSTGHVRLFILNYLGEQVAELINGRQISGKHQIRWHADNLQAGVYFCVLKTETGSKTTKMIKLK